MKKNQLKIFSNTCLSFLILSNYSCTQHDNSYEMKEKTSTTKEEIKKTDSNSEEEIKNNNSNLEKEIKNTNSNAEEEEIKNNNSTVEKEIKKIESEKEEKTGFFSFLDKTNLNLYKYFGICQAKEEDLEKEFQLEIKKLPKEEKTLVDLISSSESHYEESIKDENSEYKTEDKKNQRLKKTVSSDNHNNNEKEVSIFSVEIESYNQNSNNKSLINKEVTISEKVNRALNFDEPKENKKTEEKIKTYLIRREPFDINPHNFSKKIKKTCQIIKITNVNLKAFAEELFEEARTALSEIQRPNINFEKLNTQDKKKYKTNLSPIIERSSENNNIDTEKSHYYEPTLEALTESENDNENENDNELNYTTHSKRKIIKEKSFSNEIYDLYILRDKITEEMIDLSMKVEREYLLFYNLILAKKNNKIEFPYSTPTIKELLQIFIDSINLNNQSFFNKKILTNTKIAIPDTKDKNSNESYVTILFSSTTSQFFFELIDSKELVKAISKNIIHRIAIQRIEENFIEPGCFNCVNTPLFCCNNNCVKPKYLCHCCYFPPYITCCKEYVELCNCGIPNCFFGYCPAISNCCMHKFESSEYEEVINLD